MELNCNEDLGTVCEPKNEAVFVEQVQDNNLNLQLISVKITRELQKYYYNVQEQSSFP